MITNIEQETSDIEWFFTNGEDIGFVESGGGKLPNSVSKKSFEELELLAAYFRELSQRSEVSIDPNSKKFITPGTNKNNYLSYFKEMAEKGLYSFDKTVSNRFSDTNYHLVAKPLNPLKFNDLPLEIAEMISETKINGSVKASLDISLIL